MGEKLGQHFLINPEVAGKMIDILTLEEGEEVLEIGPGKGFLTTFLVEAGAKITGVEIDKEMVEYLRKNIINNNLKIIRADFLEIELADHNIQKICGNIPYQLSGKIIEKIVRTKSGWKVAVLTIPEAVARRVVAQPGSTDYSYLSVMCQANCEVSIEFKINKEDFEPQPKIDSAVIKFTRAREPFQDNFYIVARGAFSKKRKKIKNSLSMFFSESQNKIEKILRICDISPSRRAQEVKIEQFRRLANEFVNEGIL